MKSVQKKSLNWGGGKRKVPLLVILRYLFLLASGFSEKDHRTHL
jgi:hypothetical protein